MRAPLWLAVLAVVYLAGLLGLVLASLAVVLGPVVLALWWSPWWLLAYIPLVLVVEYVAPHTRPSILPPRGCPNASQEAVDREAWDR